jgi:hypothetical protein
MSKFPVVCGLEGDYGFKVLMVERTSTMDQVCAVAAEMLGGVVVRPIAPTERLRVRLPGADAPLAPGLTIAEAGFMELETIEIYREPRTLTTVPSDL